jgi:uncharacterized protein
MINEEYNIPKIPCKTLGPKCSIINCLYGKTVIADELIPKGTKLYEVKGELFDHPTMYTVQIDENKHINGSNKNFEFTCHKCGDPNSKLVFSDDMIYFESTRDIQPNEQITFNYCLNEWSMQNKFQCLCGSKNCLGYIAGFSNLPEEKRRELIPQLSPHILRQAIREKLI